jgi:hypothetical protein
VAGFHSGSGLAGTIAIANFVCDATRVIEFAFVTIPRSGASTMRGRVNLKSLRKNAAIRSGHFPGIWQSVGNRSVPMVHVPSYRQRLGAVASIQTLAGRNCLARARCTKEMLGTREVACMCHRAPLNAIDVPDTFVDEAITRWPPPTVIPWAMPVRAPAPGPHTPSPALRANGGAKPEHNRPRSRKIDGSLDCGWIRNEMINSRPQ